MNAGVSDVNGRIRNIYVRRTTLHGGFSNLKIVSGLDFSSRMKSESVCVRVSVTGGISPKNVIRSRTNYGYYLSMKVALIVLLILRLDGTTQNIENQSPILTPQSFREGPDLIT